MSASQAAVVVLRISMRALALNTPGGTSGKFVYSETTPLKQSARSETTRRAEDLDILKDD